MVSFLQQIFAILNTSPGNIAYHVILAFSAAGALQAALLFWRSSGLPAGGRMVLGTSLLLGLRLILFVIGGLALGGLIPLSILPPFDGSASLFGLVLIVWLWTFPDRSKIADAGAVLLGLLVLVFTGLSVVSWSSMVGQSYSASWLNLSTQGFALVIIFYGLVNLLVRRPQGWGIGLASLLILAAGHVVQLLVPNTGSDFQGAVRLAQMAAYPMLLALPQRLHLAQPELPVQPAQTAEPTLAAAPESSTWEPFLALASAQTPQQIYQAGARAFTRAFPADVCLCLTLVDNPNHVGILTGYNLHDQAEIQPYQFEGGLAVTLSNAIRRLRPVRLPASSTTFTNPRGLAQVLGFNRIGGLMVIPFLPEGEVKPIGLCVLSPFDEKTWTADEQERLTGYAALLTNLVNRAVKASQFSTQIDQANTQVKDSQTQAETARLKSEELLGQLESVRQMLSVERTRTETLASRLSSLNESQEVIARLESEINTLKAQPAREVSGNPQAEEQLKQAVSEISRLKRDLFTAESMLKKIENQDKPSSASEEQSEIMASISQELRQPMSSISGYTDLLLGESAGILGALQRKFLERIKASTERMGSLLEDLIQISSSVDGQARIAPTTVDLNAVIDDAVAMCIAQLREKNIVLRVDIPETLPEIMADRDGMMQILIHLLSNAGAASDVDGEISLHSVLKKEEGGTDYILIQVSDTGGGIPTSDLPRVFSRLYRADNPLIQGLGDTGVGLSIVKTLVEAHAGRIWVDSEMGKGSTFSVLLPVVNRADPVSPRAKGAA